LRLYLIAPAPDFGRHEDSNIGLGEPVAMMAAAGITTVAALFPPEIEIRLCDEIVQAVDYDDPADLIAISANVAQAARAMTIARRFRDKGKTVVIGGPHVSLVPEAFAGQADCLVIGEFETLVEDFVADWKAGALKPVYRGTRADLAGAPQPRWDLYPNDRALTGVVQTSRGCPFECSFCDVIQYLGRAQRHKPADRVLREIQVLYDIGYRQIHLSDDNFTVYRRRTHALLSEIAACNGAEGREPVGFLTQMSIDVTRDPELLALCNTAGLRYALVGIESDSDDALEEASKRQNLRIDRVAECEKIVRAGVSITAGLMVGFDSDDLSCFQRQYDFAMALPVVIHQVSPLVAPPATPLYERMLAEGRILDDIVKVQSSAAGASSTNIAPAQMTRAQLAEGTEWLRRAVLEPDGVIRRFERYARLLGDPPEHLQVGDGIRRSRRTQPLLQLLGRMARDPGARRVIDCVNELGRQRPSIRADLMQALGLYLNKYVRLEPAARPLAV